MPWPSHEYARQQWTPSRRQGAREDRMLTSIDTAIPPMIADRTYEVAGTTARMHEQALIAIARLEAGFGRHLVPLADFLLRSESVASSKIEHIDAGWRAFGKAFAGAKASDEAKSQLAAVQALISLVDAAGRGPITEELILSAHRDLMSVDYYTAIDSGRLRTVQNWIGGSDFTPLGAVYVPPPADQVSDLIADLIAFCDREDLPILAQAAIAHAQFESIHPFTDGNGRIGRALIGALLRRRGLTDRVTVPLASVMLADTDEYFRRLDRYRTGDAGAFVDYLSRAAVHACAAAEQSAAALADLPDDWMQIARPRAGSAEATLIPELLATPIFNADTAVEITRTSESSTYRALARLTDLGILENLSESKRNRVWAVTDVLTELDALSADIGRRVAAQ